MKNIVQHKPSRLFIILAGFFITNAIVAEFIGMKIFSVEDTLGIDRFSFTIMGHENSLMLSAGVILWPIVFIMTDIINEYFGRKGVQFLSILTAILISYGFVMIFQAIDLTPAEWWIGDYQKYGIDDMQNAFAQVYGQGLWIIVGSLVAFLVGQIVDAFVFYKVKIVGGGNRIWLRATLSTAVSQLIDSFIVLYIAFVLGPPQWETSLFVAVGTTNYLYKLLMAILLIPLLYGAHYVIEWYLGKSVADQLKADALKA